MFFFSLAIDLRANQYCIVLYSIHYIYHFSSSSFFFNKLESCWKFCGYNKNWTALPTMSQRNQWTKLQINVKCFSGKTLKLIYVNVMRVPSCKSMVTAMRRKKKFVGYKKCFRVDTFSQPTMISWYYFRLDKKGSCGKRGNRLSVSTTSVSTNNIHTFSGRWVRSTFFPI